MSEPAAFVSAIVLAAGTARRMGAPKQLLRLGGKSLLEHTLKSVEASQAGEIVLVLGAAAEEIQKELGARSKVKVAINEAFGEGMGTSLNRGLAELRPEASGALIVLADQPLVKASTLDRLMEEYRQRRPQILIPTYRGFRGNPVLLDRSVFPEIAGLQGDTGCRAIFGDHLENIQTLEVDDPGILLDADRPEDLARLESIYKDGSWELGEFETAAASDPRGPELLLVGREGVAAALGKCARLLDFRVTVVDPLLTLAEMPEATSVLRSMNFRLLPEPRAEFCVVASMGRFDEEAIAQALSVEIPYVALVANKRRSQEVLASLKLRGVNGETLGRVRTKPGLAIGAQTPAEIALSILAEIVAELRKGG